MDHPSNSDRMSVTLYRHSPGKCEVNYGFGDHTGMISNVRDEDAVLYLIETIRRLGPPAVALRAYQDTDAVNGRFPYPAGELGAFRDLVAEQVAVRVE